MIIQLTSLSTPYHPPLKPSSPSHLPEISNSGVLFRQKIIYLSTHLKINPQKALQLNPDLRSCPLSSLQSVENCLVSMGIPRASLPRILDMLPHLLTSDPYCDLYPVFDFLLHDVCIPYHDVRKSITRCPRLLLTDVDDQLRPTLSFLKKLGFRITWQNTLLLVSSVENTLVPKIEYLMNSSGFSYEEVVKMILRSPALLTYSVENNLRPKMEYFVEEIRGNLIELKRFPQYFSFSLEGRIIPRHRVLVERGIVLPLADMLKVSDGEFNTRLIEMRLDMAEKLQSFET